MGHDNMLTAVLYPDLSSASAEGTPHSARHFLSNQHRGQLTQPPAARQQIASRHCQSRCTEEEKAAESKHQHYSQNVHDCGGLYGFILRREEEVCTSVCAGLIDPFITCGVGCTISQKVREK